MSQADPAAEGTPHGRRVGIASPSVALALGIVLAPLVVQQALEPAPVSVWVGQGGPRGGVPF